MLIRSAFWVGCPKPGAEARFRDLLDGEIMPRMRALPGVSDARALWPLEREDSPPDLACQILVYFEDRAALERMLGSAERRAMRDRVAELRGMFDGAMSHINYEVGALGTTAP